MASKPETKAPQLDLASPKDHITPVNSPKDSDLVALLDKDLWLVFDLNCKLQQKLTWPELDTFVAGLAPQGTIVIVRRSGRPIHCIFYADSSFTPETQKSVLSKLRVTLGLPENAEMLPYDVPRDHNKRLTYHRMMTLGPQSSRTTRGNSIFGNQAGGPGQGGLTIKVDPSPISAEPKGKDKDKDSDTPHSSDSAKPRGHHKIASHSCKHFRVFSSFLMHPSLHYSNVVVV